MCSFYRGTIESILSSCITVWYGGCTASCRRTLQRIVRAAEKIVGAPLPSLQDIYNTRLSRKAFSIAGDSTHCLFSLLPSGRRMRSLKARTSRLKDSFVHQAVRMLNSLPAVTPLLSLPPQTLDINLHPSTPTHLHTTPLPHDHAHLPISCQNLACPTTRLLPNPACLTTRLLPNPACLTTHLLPNPIACLTTRLLPNPVAEPRLPDYPPVADPSPVRLPACCRPIACPTARLLPTQRLSDCPPVADPSPVRLPACCRPIACPPVADPSPRLGPLVLCHTNWTRTYGPSWAISHQQAQLGQHDQALQEITSSLRELSLTITSRLPVTPVPPVPVPSHSAYPREPFIPAPKRYEGDLGQC
ncbi:hypothetical protein N1851_033757 [Merluccius polli]|uniref:Uncharacterized protein n=1 Tax=Merluccius polli TaxID=89951 RepID=A0AA47NMB2_MERPO|nr:hypothetical protein N1851_033757 [Merluccius polli]